MMATKENVIKALGEAGLLGSSQNRYFTCFVMPSAGQFAVYGTFAGVANQFGGYIINVTENGVGILPLSSSTGNPVNEKAALLPFKYIARVEAKSGGLFAYKTIDIITIKNEKISFKVTKKVLPNPDHQSNVDYFLSLYGQK